MLIPSRSRSFSHISFVAAFHLLVILSFSYFVAPQIVRTVMSDTASLNKNNIQQSMLFLLYAVGFSVGPVIGGFLVTANFRWVFAIK